MTIYRKYRPQIFKDIIGQEHVKTTLENEIKQDKISHAYLFSGSRGIGKTTMARLLAKALNCQERKKGEAEPCNKCFICQEINHGHFIDLIEIDAASNRGIGEIRELRERVRFAPSSAKYKVFIIDEAHMLTIEAFNALLKTLEEPPKHIVFILATTEPHKLPETIISRCQRFDFKKIDPEEIAKRLGKIAKQEGVKIDKEVLQNISYHCQGSSRDAEGLLGQVLSLGEKKIGLEQLEIVLPRSDLKLVVELVDYLIKKETSASLMLINRLIEEGVDLEQFTGDLIEFLRKILIFKVGAQAGSRTLQGASTLRDYRSGYQNLDYQNLDKETNKKIQGFSQEMEIEKIIEIIELFIEKKNQLKWSEIPQLPLELAIIGLIKKTEELPSRSSEAPSLLRPSEEASSFSRSSEESSFSRSSEASSRSPKASSRSPKASPPRRKQEHENIKTEKQQLRQPKKPEQSEQVEQLEHITLEQIQAKWSDILKEVKKLNHSLSAFLEMGKIIFWEEGILSLAFAFKFHQDKIKDIKNKRIIEEIFSQVLGIKKIQIKPILEIKKEEGVLGKIMGVFGGKVEE